MTLGLILALAGSGLAAGAIMGPRNPRLWLVVTLGGLTASLEAALTALLEDGPGWEWCSAFTLGGERIHLRLDGLSALFLALLCILGGATAVYSREYWGDREHPDSAPSGRVWTNVFLLAMGLVLLSSNGIHFLIGWELFTVSAYFLITLDRQRRAARAAGWLYLASSHAGTMCLFAFFVTLSVRTGSWDLGPMRGQAELAPLFWLVLFGFGVKAGMFPVHVWLPSAHGNAPSHVSALMSGVAINMGIYGIVRFSGWLPMPAGAGWTVLGLGAAGALLGIALAFVQTDLKRLLAYCSVENVGVILIGVGGAMLGAGHGDEPWGRLAMAGALLHVWNHGLSKSLLFFGSGAVLHATGKREMSLLGGLWRAMPWTAALFALGAVSIAGLPPLNGFVSEWLIYLGLFDAAASRGPATWAAMPAVVILGMSGALALATFVKASATVFLGVARTAAASEAHECGVLMRASMVALGGACFVIGLAPVLFWRPVARAVSCWRPEWAPVAQPASLSSLGAAQVAVAVSLCAVAAWLWRKTVASGVRRAPTWDCGYSAPNARMQYTGGSFSGIVLGWFAGILGPERQIGRPRGPFPSRSVWMEFIPDAVLERVMKPAGGAVLRLATAARGLQHGRLQFYIVYLLGGLTVVAIVVWIGAGQ